MKRSPRSTSEIAEAPTGFARLRWLGPGLLWMVSATGSGELLFTPRVGALYGYTLVWALIVAVSLKWFVNREIGRFAVCTGTDLLTGILTLDRAGRWAVVVIVVPQLFVAVATIAGLGGSAATALVLALPGATGVWAVVGVALSTVIVVRGGYRGVEKVATVIALALGIASVAAAISVGPDIAALGSGLVPALPAQVDAGEVLPWLGFMLSGAAGMIWYSYWIVAKGYGRRETEPTRPRDTFDVDDVETIRLRGWLRQMTIDNSVAVVGTLIITLAFLILGTELLRPEGLLPEEDEIAETLGRLLGDVWGRAGFWFMVLALFVGFWDTVLSDQDGFGRMFSTAARPVVDRLPMLRRWNEQRLRRAIVIVVLAVIPLLLYFAVGEPVVLLALAGIVEAAHIPVVAVLTLRLNKRHLPRGLQPTPWAVAGTVTAAAFFAAFTVFYVVRLL